SCFTVWAAKDVSKDSIDWKHSLQVGGLFASLVALCTLAPEGANGLIKDIDHLSPWQPEMHAILTWSAWRGTQCKTSRRIATVKRPEDIQQYHRKAPFYLP